MDLVAILKKFARRRLSMLDLLKQIEDTDKKIVLVGNDAEAKIIEKRIKNKANYWGKVRFSEEFDGHDINELLYEDIEEFIVVITEETLLRRYEGYFHNIGISQEQIYSIRTHGVAGKLDVYDVLVGYTKESENGLPGYTIFGENNDSSDSSIDNMKPEKFVVLTLGGSTTDPSTGNLTSWSEFLYRDLVKLFPNVQVVCGGVNSHVVSQELIRLIRDGYLFKPDMVISYSAVNDFSDRYHDEINPFILNYQKRIVKTALNKKIMNGNDILQRGVLTKYSLGVPSENPISPAKHWIHCEKVMKSVADGYGADFIGILQPQNFECTEFEAVRRNKHYPEAIDLVAAEDQEWLLDFTKIFDGEENIFYDFCHVYEKGNKILEKKILPYVMKSMKRKGVI